MFLFGKDEVYVHGVRVPANPTNASDLSLAEMHGRADAHAMYRLPRVRTTRGPG